jgi:hypothetical protein
MTLVKVNAKPDPNHQIQMGPQQKYGYACTLNAQGELIADVPEDMLPGELAAGRVKLISEDAEN